MNSPHSLTIGSLTIPLNFSGFRRLALHDPNWDLLAEAKVQELGAALADDVAVLDMAYHLAQAHQPGLTQDQFDGQVDADCQSRSRTFRELAREVADRLASFTRSPDGVRAMIQELRKGAVQHSQAMAESIPTLLMARVEASQRVLRLLAKQLPDRLESEIQTLISNGASDDTIRARVQQLLGTETEAPTGLTSSAPPVDSASSPGS